MMGMAGSFKTPCSLLGIQMGSHGRDGREEVKTTALLSAEGQVLGFIGDI